MNEPLAELQLDIASEMYIQYVYTPQGGNAMLKAKVFQSGNSQAIRIPKELQTSEKEFIIRKIGNCYFLMPVDDPWALLRQCIGQVEEDIDFDRNQPLLNELTKREEL